MKTTSKVTIVHLGDSTTELGSPSRQRNILSLESKKQRMIFAALIVVFPGQLQPGPAGHRKGGRIERSRSFWK